MRIFEIAQIDAFARRPFEGNPAAIIPLTDWPDDATLQAIAAENNLSETAYTERLGEGRYRLRWFTPAQEVPLCGHATLAAAHYLYTEKNESSPSIVFETMSGPLEVAREGEGYAMSFPADPPTPAGAIDGLAEAMGAAPAEVLRGQYIMAVYRSAEDVAALAPDPSALMRLAAREGGLVACVIATAPGGAAHDGAPVDFVSRFFAPSQGIPEDPVTGSAHCMLAPFWAERLGKSELVGFQASARGGLVACQTRGDRVRLRGRAVTYLRGEIAI